MVRHAGCRDDDHQAAFVRGTRVLVDILGVAVRRDHAELVGDLEALEDDSYLLDHRQVGRRAAQYAHHWRRSFGHPAAVLGPIAHALVLPRPAMSLRWCIPSKRMREQAA